MIACPHCADLQQQIQAERYGLWHHARPDGKCADDCPACERRGLQERVKFTENFENEKSDGIAIGRLSGDVLAAELRQQLQAVEQAAGDHGWTPTASTLVQFIHDIASDRNKQIDAKIAAIGQLQAVEAELKTEHEHRMEDLADQRAWQDKAEAADLALSTLQGRLRVIETCVQHKPECDLSKVQIPGWACDKPAFFKHYGGQCAATYQHEGGVCWTHCMQRAGHTGPHRGSGKPGYPLEWEAGICTCGLAALLDPPVQETDSK